MQTNQENPKAVHNFAFHNARSRDLCYINLPPEESLSHHEGLNTCRKITIIILTTITTMMMMMMMMMMIQLKKLSNRNSGFQKRYQIPNVVIFGNARTDCIAGS